MERFEYMTFNMLLSGIFYVLQVFQALKRFILSCLYRVVVVHNLIKPVERATTRATKTSNANLMV
jgi:hypothetical protein